jgi:hypothetical protein
MTERAKYWAERVAAWEQSGLTQLQFCRQQGLNGGTFAWWKRKLGRRAAAAPKRRGRPPKSSRSFVEVRLTGTSPASYEVVLARGRCIRVPAQFDPQTLSRLIKAVETC